MSQRRPKGRQQQHLDHWPNLRQALVALTAEVGHFPTLNELERRGRYDIMRAMVRHGGSLSVGKRLAAETAGTMTATDATTPATGSAGPVTSG